MLQTNSDQAATNQMVIDNRQNVMWLFNTIRRLELDSAIAMQLNLKYELMKEIKLLDSIMRPSPNPGGDYKNLFLNRPRALIGSKPKQKCFKMTKSEKAQLKQVAYKNYKISLLNQYPRSLQTLEEPFRQPQIRLKQQDIKIDHKNSQNKMLPDNHTPTRYHQKTRRKQKKKQ